MRKSARRAEDKKQVRAENAPASHAKHARQPDRGSAHSPAVCQSVPLGAARKELPHAERRRAKPDGCAHGQSGPPVFPAALRGAAAFVLPVRCRLTRVPPLFLRAAALPACRRHILAPGNNGPLLLLFQKSLVRHSENSSVIRSGKGSHRRDKIFLSFLKKRLAFSKIIGYNNQALERDAEK